MGPFKRVQILVFLEVIVVGSTCYGQAAEGFNVAVDTAAQMLVVDPLGRRKGFDPVTSLSYNEIPHTVYWNVSTPSIDEPGDDESGDIHEFGVNEEFQPVMGNYLIRLYGVKNDSIRLTITFVSEIPSIVRELSIRKGQAIIYRLTYGPGVPPIFDSVGNAAAVKCGIGFGGPGSVKLSAKSTMGFGTTDTLRRSLITARWKAGVGFNLGGVLSTTYGFEKQGDPVIQGVYTYQKFITIQPTILNWQVGQEYTLFEVAMNDPAGIGQFELTNALTGGEWFVDINYLDKTDSVSYQKVAKGFAFQNKSAGSGATAFSGERHAAIKGTRFHEVYESAGEIIYRRKDLNAASWDTTARISPGNGSNNDASISVAHDGSVHIVWQRQLNANAFALWYNRSTDGGLTWGTPFRPASAESVVIIQSNQWNIYPLVAELGASQLVIVVCSNAGPRFMKSTNLGTSWTTLATIPGVSYGSYVWHPSLAPGSNFLLLSYDTRYYGLFSKKYDGTNWLTELNVANGTGTSYSRNSSVAVGVPDVPHIAWAAQRAGQGEYRILYKSGSYGATAWNSFYTEFPFTTGISDYYPSISPQQRGGSTWRIDVLYANTANQIRLNQQTYSSWSGPAVVSTTGQWPVTTLQEANSSLYNGVRLWTDQSGTAPFEIKRASDGSYQLQAIAGTTIQSELHRRVTVESVKNGSFVSCEIGLLKVADAKGDTAILPFKTIDPGRPFEATLSNAWDYLGTDSILLPTSARSLIVETDIRTIVRADTLAARGKADFAIRTFQVSLLGAKGTVSLLGDSQGLSGRRTIDISAWAGQKVLIRPSATVDASTGEVPIVGIGDIYVNKGK
jgi:hypothetical protein